MQKKSFNLLIILLGFAVFVVLVILLSKTFLFKLTPQAVDPWAKTYRQYFFDDDQDTYRDFIKNHECKNLFDYDRIAYIETYGDEYIDTKYVPTSDTKVNIRFSLVATKSEQYIIYRATRSALYGLTTDRDKPCISYGKTFYTVKTCPFNANNIYEVIIDKGLYINGDKYQVFSDKFEYIEEPTLLLFKPTEWKNRKFFKKLFEGRNFHMVGKLYHLYIYENDVIQKFFVPARLSTDITNECSSDGKTHKKGEVGLVEVLSGLFYPNLGNGTLGPIRQ